MRLVDRPYAAGWRMLSRIAAAAQAVVQHAHPRDNAGMDIQLNGEPRSIADGFTLLDLLQAEGLGERRVAVEVNGDIIPRGRHATARLHPGDRIEIVHALGGG